MAVPRWLRRTWERSTTLAGTVFVVALFALALGAAVTGAFVHHTAQPQFCNSCHLMEPYYESWRNSKHKDVACIDCHYEPGSLETLEGKFKALSQLAKYVTRTQGTKPWAEVSDQSCMRSGCHSVRMLDGPVMFGDISFDHRHHVLESRRGRRLRCTSCHGQNLPGEHVAVTGAVCVTCHFMPGKDGKAPAETSDCLICHGPPKEPVAVAGRNFVHADYVERGVNCKECHNPVVEGAGTVRQERCHSCHTESGHVERIGETAFLHEKHVTEHKVECFECHDEIHHGLLPLKKPEAAKQEGCGVCHANTHDAASLVYSGTGAVGVDEQQSRMYQTRVVCEACHTGRSGRRPTKLGLEHGESAPAAAGGAHALATHGSSVASAGNVDCIHCHGPEYDGLLGQWQSAVGEQLERMKPMLAELETKLAASPESPARVPFEEAQRNYLLVAMDGSRGAHNVSYALNALRAGAERIDSARQTLGVAADAHAADGFPFRSKDGCTTCHAGAGRPASVWKGEERFPHQRHLAQGMECNSCHSTEQHGKPSFPRSDCAKCHHEPSEKRDVTDCASCHKDQALMLAGKPVGFAEKPGNMATVGCSDCHGEAPAIMRPQPKMCVLCHEPGFDQQHLDWQKSIDALTAQLSAAIAGADKTKVDAQALELAKKALDTVRRDGSRGIHNIDLSKILLEDALRAIEKP